MGQIGKEIYSFLLIRLQCYDITFYDEQSLVILSDSNWEQILQEASSDIKFGEDLIAEEQIGQVI